MHQLGSGRGLGSHDMTMPIHTNNPMICVEMQEKVNILRIVRCLIELDDVMDENEESSGWTLHQISCHSHYRYFRFSFWEKQNTPPPLFHPLVQSSISPSWTPKKVLNVWMVLVHFGWQEFEECINTMYLLVSIEQFPKHLSSQFKAKSELVPWGKFST